MITVEKVSKIFGGEYIFKDVSFTVNDNDKIGIVGRNGVGKSTLLSILENDEKATDGRVIYSSKKVAFLSQEKQLNPKNTINEEIKDIMAQFINIKKRMDEIIEDVDFANSNDLIEEYGILENKYNVLGGYEIESKVRRVLGIFGFELGSYNKKISDFSGGEKTRLALVKILLSEPDYLILDEPTNHLDVNTIEWLEDFLRTKARGVIVVSHDRFFLQRVCTKIIELSDGNIVEYNTTYKNYLNERSRRHILQLQTFENQEKEIAKLQEFIDKNKMKDSKIGQVNDRKKKIEMMEVVKKPILDNDKISFTIDGFRNKKASYVDMLECSVGYDKPLINNIDFTIRGGDKIGIIGENGAGKSTLIKTMTREIKPFSGRCILHQKISIGYFEQEQDFEDNDITVFDVIEPLMSQESKTMIRRHLAQFLFKGDDVYKKVNMLSGGEKVRLIFAKFVLNKYDMIILDEPTNHLDLSAKRELEEVLNQYPGTLILISHDRYFLNQIVNKVFVINENNYSITEGNYEDYLTQKEVVKSTLISKKEKKHKIIKVRKKSTKKLESYISKLELQKEKLTLESQNPKVYNDWEIAKNISDKIRDIEVELDIKYLKLLEEMDE